MLIRNVSEAGDRSLAEETGWAGLVDSFSSVVWSQPVISATVVVLSAAALLSLCCLNKLCCPTKRKWSPYLDALDQEWQKESKTDDQGDAAKRLISPNMYILPRSSNVAVNSYDSNPKENSEEERLLGKLEETVKELRTHSKGSHQLRKPRATSAFHKVLDQVKKDKLLKEAKDVLAEYSTLNRPQSPESSGVFPTTPLYEPPKFWRLNSNLSAKLPSPTTQKGQVPLDTVFQKMKGHIEELKKLRGEVDENSPEFQCIENEIRKLGTVILDIVPKKPLTSASSGTTLASSWTPDDKLRSENELLDALDALQPNTSWVSPALKRARPPRMMHPPSIARTGSRRGCQRSQSCREADMSRERDGLWELEKAVKDMQKDITRSLETSPATKPRSAVHDDGGHDDVEAMLRELSSQSGEEQVSPFAFPLHQFSLDK